MAGGMTHVAANAVIGREDELGSLFAFLDAVEDGPCVLVLSGEAGIGKTVLWETAVERARSRMSGTVLAHRSVEAEASLSFAGLSDLVTPVLDQVASCLAPLRRHALEVALLLVEPGEQAPDPRAIGMGLLDVLRALAEHGPILLALDDLQWLDPSSAAVLQIALRRLRDEHVALLASVREGPPASTTLELERAFREERRTRLALRPLSLGALHRLLRERLALELARPELARLLETSGGNPFLALELGRQLQRTGTRPEAGRALPVPQSLRELLVGRLARLPADTGDVLLIAAALARPTVELVAETHGNREDAFEALAAAEREGVVELEGTGIRFSHPLLASICYERAPPWTRRAVHRALAGAVADIEERARHLALAAEEPDTIVAGALAAAGEQAAGRGATAAAAELCELAAELTPGGDAAAGRQRRLRAAELYRLAGAGDRAVAMLRELLVDAPSGPERADILFALATTRRDDVAALIQFYDEALAAASGDDARCARLLSDRGYMRVYQADIRGAVADCRAALEKAERVGDPVLLAGAIGRLAVAEGRAGEITPGLLERGLEIEQRLGLLLGYQESPRVSLTRRLIGLGQLDRARVLLEEAEQDAAARGDEVLRAQFVQGLARLEWLAGRWDVALRHCDFADEVWDQTQGHARHGQALAGYLRALVETDLGLVGEAQASALKGLACAEAMADEEWTVLTLGVLGRLELALGELEAAGDYLRELPARLRSRGYNDPTVPLWADAIETLVALGEHDRALGYLEPYEHHARRMASPLAAGGAARCRGLLAAADGKLDVAVREFERALAEFDGLPYPLERGRTLACLGSAHRQAKQKRLARDALERSLESLEELGARLWANKARTELRRISGRRRASEELTETERRVAALAAQGRSNKEIAAELFMSVHTVGAHLSRAYRKLGIGSRAKLASRLATPGGDAKRATDAAKPTSGPPKL
jgi:ATP/maltotriose-dependent transcriptional regulator MalT